MQKIHIAPSLLAADFAHLAKEIARIQAAGLTHLHFDVMDGHFVPNLSFGAPVLAAITKLNHGLVNDVHLMISDPLKFAPDFVHAGANIITFHLEALADDTAIWQLIHYLKKVNVRVGVALKPATPVRALLPYLSALDLVLVMSVEPGFGGQEFMPLALDKIAELVDLRTQNNLDFVIEVDGGINPITSQLAIKAGAEMLVAGSFLFGPGDLSRRAERLIHD